MTQFTIPTREEIVEKYSSFVGLSEEEQLAKRKKELEAMKKDELIVLLLEKEQHRTDTVQELAKAILQDPELIAADYETIAAAIRELKPEARTSAKSIASYVSKKREEWSLPQRIRISRQR